MFLNLVCNYYIYQKESPIKYRRQIITSKISQNQYIQRNNKLEFEYNYYLIDRYYLLNIVYI